jgi:predicted ATP-grasp superfamily ATP-dependent carboligase
MTSLNILVLDAAQRSALAVVRSLGQQPGLRITTAEAAPTALAGTSRYSREYLTCPSAEHQPQAFVDWISRLQTERQFDLVLPVTEITSQLILMNQDKLALPTAFADYSLVMQLADKHSLMQLADKLQVPTPKWIFYSSLSALNQQGIQYPCVIKPALSRLYLNDHWQATTVGIIRDAESLESYLNKNTYLHNTGFMLQEFIPGYGAGVFCLYNRGQPVTFFAHKRLREKPPQGGVSVLSESQAVDPELQSIAEKLLTAANWHGVAMVEFRISPEGKPYLMEINTRFWGSLQLSIDSGLDFPWLLTAQTLNLPHQIPADYKIGQRLRWLLGDFDSLYLYWKSDESLAKKIKRSLDFLWPGFFTTRYEINRWSDLKPALFELKQYLAALRGH